MEPTVNPEGESLAANVPPRRFLPSDVKVASMSSGEIILASERVQPTSDTTFSTRSDTELSPDQIPLSRYQQFNEYFTQQLETIESLLASYVPPSYAAQTSEECQRILQNEIATEQRIEAEIAELLKSVRLVERELLSDAREKYLTATGVLDRNAREVSIIAGLSGLATFSGAVVAALMYEHTALELIGHVVHKNLGYGPISYPTEWTADALTIFATGIGCLCASLFGPAFVGMAKTLGGRVTRFLSQESAQDFHSRAVEAHDIQHELQGLFSSMADGVVRLQGALSNFYAQNEDTRVALSSVLLSQSHSSEPAAAVIHEDIHRCSTALGSAELLTLMQSLNLERILRELSQREFRSPELIAAVDGTTSAPWESGILRGLRWGLGSVTTLFQGGFSIGKTSALSATDVSKTAFENLPPGPINDVISGLGSGLSTNLDMALRVSPDKSAYAVVKTVFELAHSYFGGAKEGPRLESFLRVILDLDELMRGNKTRWFSKLIPCLIRAATQKPILIEHAEQLEASAGIVNPKSIGAELAERKGKRAAIQKMIFEVTKLAGQTAAEGFERICFIAPLKALQTSPLVAHIAPSIAEWAAYRLEQHTEAVERDLRKRMGQSIAHIPHGERFSAASDETLDLAVMTEYVRYTHRKDSHLSSDEMTSLLDYWALRRKAAFKERTGNEHRLAQELDQISPELNAARKIVHSQANVFSAIARALVADSKSGELTAPTQDPHEAMKRGLTNWQNTLKQLPRPEREIIFDATSDGLLAAVLTTEGIIKLKSAGEISQSFTRGLESSGPPYIPTNADSVRITVSEMILAMRLEPFQRRILINTHDELSDGSITENQALERLTDAGFKREQLLGSASGAFRGLFELGVIGKRPKPLGNLVV